MPAPWDYADFDDHEGVHLLRDAASGLTAIIAVHSTALGPAAGGTRFWHYPDPADAITDALRLSRGMSYKNAMAGLPMGGGKAVVLAGPDRAKSPALLAAFGRAIDGLGGRYITAEDVGMS
ncbi:MAG: amino acid dehydrogenase, partial [Sphingomonadales bacterium]